MRSLLLVSLGAKRFASMSEAGDADALLFDLAAAERSNLSQARRDAVQAIAGARQIAPRRPLFVRIHAVASGLLDGDIDIVMPARPDGVVLAQIIGIEDTFLLDARLSVREALHGLEDRSTAILVEVGSAAAAMLRFDQGSSRLAGLLYTAAGGDQAAFERRLAIASARSAGVPLLDASSNTLESQSLENDCRVARQAGFAGKLAVDVAQIAIINQVFSTPI